MDDDRDSGTEEMQLSNIDLLFKISEIVSFIITLTFSAVIVKLSNFGNAFIYMHHTQSTETQVEEACSLHEKDGIYVDVNAENRTAFVTYHFCPRLKMLLRGFRNNVLHVVQQHIEGSDHKKNRGQGRMTQYLTSTKRKSLEDFTIPFMAALCLGYRPSTNDESYHQEMQLMLDFDMSRDVGFFPDRSVRTLYLKSDSTTPILSTMGSFRSKRCISVTKSIEYPLAAHCCLHCMNIPRSRQYQSLIQIVTEGPNKHRPIQCELVGNLRLRYREQKNNYDIVRLQLINAAKMNARRQRSNICHVCGTHQYYKMAKVF